MVTDAQRNFAASMLSTVCLDAEYRPHAKYDGWMVDIYLTSWGSPEELREWVEERIANDLGTADSTTP